MTSETTTMQDAAADIEMMTLPEVQRELAQYQKANRSLANA
jgi:hypothetical protein